MEARRYDPALDDLPRAPSQEEWDRLSPEEQQRAVEALPSEITLAIPEGDPHRIAKEQAFQALDEHFRRIRRRVYLSSELPVYYPDEPIFAPDIIAVLDVDPHKRMRWVVSHERRGIDLALELFHHGRRKKAFGRRRRPSTSRPPKKAFHDNVERFLRLRIPEYFAYDIESEFLLGWRLHDDRYETIVPTEGRVPSTVLGLDLAVDRGRLCFYDGAAPLPDSRELIQRISTLADDAVRRADRLAARLRELGVDPE